MFFFLAPDQPTNPFTTTQEFWGFFFVCVCNLRPLLFPPQNLGAGAPLEALLIGRVSSDYASIKVFLECGHCPFLTCTQFLRWPIHEPRLIFSSFFSFCCIPGISFRAPGSKYVSGLETWQGSWLRSTWSSILDFFWLCGLNNTFVGSPSFLHLGPLYSIYYLHNCPTKQIF